MEIAIFTHGKFTQIGVNRNNKQLLKTIDSKILYQDPDKFADRFLHLLSHLFGISNFDEHTKIIFAISGIIDGNKKEIIESKVLNSISFSKYFNGFNFENAFKSLINSENIFLIDTAKSVAFGALTKKKKSKQFPMLSLFIDENLEISIIKKNGIIYSNYALRPIKDLEGKTADYHLCDLGIYNILNEQTENVFIEYTNRLILILKEFLIYGKEDGFDFKEIFIHSNKSEFIIRKLLHEAFPSFEITITDGLNEDQDLPIKGLFKSFNILSAKTTVFTAGFLATNLKSKFENHKKKNEIESYLKNPVIGPIVSSIMKHIALSQRITHIKYFSSDGIERDKLDNYSMFIKHWERTKPIGSGKNYYFVYFNDKTKMKIYLDNLKSVTDMERYILDYEFGE